MRAITFPKTAEGVWTNRETGVRIVKHLHGSYKILRPALTVNGHVRWSIVCASLKEARQCATGAVGRVRDEIAAAYDEAVSEERAHVEERILGRRRRADQIDAWTERHGYRGHLTESAMERLVGRDHEDALYENSRWEAVYPERISADRRHAARVIEQARRKPERTPVEAYLAGDTDELDLPVLDPEQLTPEIPDEALAMNAGFDLAQRVTSAMHTRRENIAALSHVHPADFIANVRRFGGAR